MSIFKENVNKMVTCPFDPAHRMLQSRLQAHITKCRLNHLETPLKPCPFNATHIPKAADYNYHLMNCPDRAVVDKQLAAGVCKDNVFKGRTIVPNYNQPVVPISSECWDEDIGPVGAAGYTPRNPTSTRGIIIDLGMTKPAERKKIYQQRFTEEDDNDISSQPRPIRHPEPQIIRQPRQTPETVLQSKNLGLGRGLPTVPSNKIAAGIFGQRQPRESYQQVISSVNAAAGIGRGRPLMSPRVIDDDDFPPLG